MGYVWRTLWQRKVRTALAVLGVGAAVAGVVALTSVARGMRQSVDQFMTATGASLVVFNKNAMDPALSSVTNQEIETIAAMEGVEAIARANFTMLAAPRVGEGRPPLPLVLCFGRVPGERLLAQKKDALTAGALPAARDEIAVGILVAERVGVKVGERLPIFHRKHFGIDSYKVVGIYESGIAWENGGILIHADVVQAELNRTDSYSTLFVYAQDGAIPEVRARIESQFNYLTGVPVAQATSQFGQQMEFVDDFIRLITAIAVAIGILGVLNTMMMSIAERTREIGTLRALGWSRGLVLRHILLEGVLLSIVGGLVGLALGWLGTEGVLYLFRSKYLEARYVPETFIRGMGMALTVGLFAAIYPAWRAANLRPVEALRYE